ncbi:MAG: malate/lactate/ureidoglycolate dehydrogenase [Rhodospirillales bacterium]|jgi:uncharacterized oxidoreductase
MSYKPVPTLHVSVSEVTPYLADILRGMGSDDGEADIVARNLVDANLAGHDSHGIGMLPAYKRALDAGFLKANTRPTAVKDTGPIMVFNGNRGYGQAVGYEVTETAIKRAKKNGFVLAALRDAHHIGRIGAWGEMCAAAGLISIHYVNGYSGMKAAPFGGSDARYLTNPYCTAIPGLGDEPPFILDMATTEIAMGKVRIAYNSGKQVQEGALIDSDGRPTTNPAVMYEGKLGALQAFGQHKGYGLALVCDLLGGGLTGGGTHLPERNQPPGIHNNMFMIIMQPGLFDDADTVMADMHEFRNHVLASPPAPGVEAVMMPGDPERKSRAKRLLDGLPIDETTWNDIAIVARDVGVIVPVL